MVVSPPRLNSPRPMRSLLLSIVIVGVTCVAAEGADQPTFDVAVGYVSQHAWLVGAALYLDQNGALVGELAHGSATYPDVFVDESSNFSFMIGARKLYRS